MRFGTEEYVKELLSIMYNDERILGNYNILAYMPHYSFSKDVRLKDEDIMVNESFDCFKALDLRRNKEVIIYYGDHDSFGVCSSKTIMKKL
jgi:hypothetical protein